MELSWGPRNTYSVFACVFLSLLSDLPFCPSSTEFLVVFRSRRWAPKSTPLEPRSGSLDPGIRGAWSLDPGAWILEPWDPGSLDPEIWEPGSLDPGTLGTWTLGAWNPEALVPATWDPGS